MHAHTYFITMSPQDQNPVKKPYEPGMKVTYDPASRRVVVAFRGRITVLPETYETEAQGTAAGESHCRSHGWNPGEQAHSLKRPLRTLF